MAWTAPRTWSTSEVVTSAMMNTHLRNNLSVLKTGRADDGRVSELSAATVADLSGANVTGLAVPGAGNAFTSGTSRMLSDARLRLPVGADKYDTVHSDAATTTRRGAWVEGDYIHHVADNQTTEWRYLGEYVSTPGGALAGSVWVEGDYLHYVDADGDERRCLSAGSAGHSDAAALGGSLWVETYLHWVRQSGSLEMPGHGDVVHSDGTVHNDSHGDVTHSDSHTDQGHNDSHGDTAHEDAAHGDLHDDAPYNDHQDGFDHEDVPHEDAHNDAAHNDAAHQDSHSDTSHNDTHGDVAHDDQHSDHSDHGDAAHADNPAVVA